MIAAFVTQDLDMRTLINLGLFTLIALNLCACHSLLSKIRVVDIEQGSVVTQQQVKHLHKGMKKEQVKALLGDPIYSEAFNDNRLDYVYSKQIARKSRQTQVLTIYFAHDRLSHYTTQRYTDHD